MSGFLIRKMWKRRWLILCLLLGNILLVGTISATPMFNTATMTRILRQEMRNFQVSRNILPATVAFEYGFNAINEENRISGYETNRDYWLPHSIAELGIPVEQTIRTDIMGRWAFLPVVTRENTTRVRTPHLLALENFDTFIELTYGRLPSPELVNGNTIEVIASEIVLFNQNILADEKLIATDIYTDDPDKNLYIHVVGIYTISEGAELIWSTLRVNQNTTLLMNPELIHSHFIPNYHNNYRLTTRWLYALNPNAMSATRTAHYLNTLEQHRERFGQFYNENISPTIHLYRQQANQLSTTLLVLQLPMFIMLALYIYMVSRQILQLEQNDISVIKSRGASRGQILGLYIM